MNMSIARVGGACAIVAVVFFSAWPLFPTIGSALGIEFPQSLDMAEWAQVRTDHRAAFLTVDWLVIFGMGFELAAAVGFFWVLRKAGPFTWLGLAAWLTGLILVMVEHILVLVIHATAAPGYVAADEAVKPAWAAIIMTLEPTSLFFADVGNTLDWGVGVPILALASLHMHVVPKWIGWLGVLVGALMWCGNLVGLLEILPRRPLYGGAAMAFSVWLGAMGVVFLRLREPVR